MGSSSSPSSLPFLPTVDYALPIAGPGGLVVGSLAGLSSFFPFSTIAVLIAFTVLSTTFSAIFIPNFLASAGPIT